MRVYFATNRNPDDPDNPTSFGDTHSAQGLMDLRFGWADFTSNDFKTFKITVASEKLPTDKAALSTGKPQAQALGSTEVFQKIYDEMRSLKKDCIISIHGFDYTFEEALQRTAELQSFYDKHQSVFFLFSWPSEGSLAPFRAYYNDRKAVRISGAALGRGIMKFMDYLISIPPKEYCHQSVHIFAHSMGNYALRWALQGIKEQLGSRLQRVFEQILIFAADEDDDAFEYDEKLKNLSNLCRRVTVYHNPGDKALVISDLTKGNPDRLGAGGPRNSRLLPDKVSVVNVEPALTFSEDPTGHQYYRLNERVKTDVLGVLAGTDPTTLPGRKFLPETKGYKLG